MATPPPIADHEPAGDGVESRLRTAVERETACAIGERARGGVPVGLPPAAEARARRPGDGARVQRPRAARGAVPVRRRGPGVPLARRPRPPPDRLPGGGARRRRRRSSAAMRISGTPGRPRRARRRRGRRRAPSRPPVHRRRDARRRRWGRCAGCGSDGVASSVDLLGEATVTEAEADRYAARCAEAIERWRRPRRGWPAREAARGRRRSAPLPRANVCVKVSALTPLLRPDAPERGQRDAAGRLRPLLRAARTRRRAPAHRHGVAGLPRGGARARARRCSTRTSSPTGRRPGSCSRPTCATRPTRLAQILDWARATRARPPLTVRLVKGAYWDHELVQARQHGWEVPVFEDKRECDRNFEALTAELLDGPAGAAGRRRLAQPALGRPRDRRQPGRRRR